MLKQMINIHKVKIGNKSLTKMKLFNFSDAAAEVKAEAPKDTGTAPQNAPNTTATIIKSEKLAKYKEAIEGFNKDWSKIAKEKEAYRIKRVRDELTPSQRKFIELLASKLTSLNFHQINYVLKNYTEKMNQRKTIAPISVNPHWLDLQKDLSGQIPGEGTKFADHEELMKNLAKWYQSQIPGFGIGAGAPQPVEAKKEETKEEKKPEVKKEKEAYDLELSSFDAAKKIVLIKEVRAALNLGLKEAKELVEKAPVLLMKGVKKADTEALVKKFQENGGVIKLK